jgi:pimeloyl-ACP methyl ester carboxylesterase
VRRSSRAPAGIAISPDRFGGGASVTEPLVIARQGYFFAGGNYEERDGQKVLTGQLYVEFQIPAEQRCPYPVIMVHGGGQSGANFTGTPDGREGWAQHFLRRGYAVYVVDQVGRGRSIYRPGVYGALRYPEVERAQERFIAMKRLKLWPQAEKHTQWPGGDAPGDAVFDEFIASQLPSIVDMTEQQELNVPALIALIDKIGPSILLTHSQSGSFGWPVADARPDQVKALLAIEPNGPPFHDVGIDYLGPPDQYKTGALARRYGLSDLPLTFDPPLAPGETLAFEREANIPAPGLARGWLQKAPARQLPHLKKMPILVLSAEASYHATYDHLTVRFLEQAGVKPSFIRLEDRNIRGNGHMLMLEKNNHEIAALIMDFLAAAL